MEKENSLAYTYTLEMIENVCVVCVCASENTCLQCKHTAKRIPFAKRIVLSLSQFSFATTKTFENFRGIVYLYVHLLSVWEEGENASYIIDMGIFAQMDVNAFCLCPTEWSAYVPSNVQHTIAST